MCFTDQSLDWRCCFYRVPRVLQTKAWTGVVVFTESRVSYRPKPGLALLFLQSPACLTDQSLDWRCFTARVPHIVTDQSLNWRCFRVPRIVTDQSLDSGVLLLLCVFFTVRVPRIVTDQIKTRCVAQAEPPNRYRPKLRHVVLHRQSPLIVTDQIKTRCVALTEPPNRYRPKLRHVVLHRLSLLIVTDQS